MPVLKATPRLINLGFEDSSRQPITIEPEAIPQHLPLIPLLTQRGPTEPQVVVGDGAAQMYGAVTFDEQGKYTTHQTLLARVCSAQGNKFMGFRLKPAGAKTAMLRLSLEVIPCEVPLYERNPDGTIALDANGNPIQEMNGSDLAFVVGHRLVWHTARPSNASGEYGAGVIANNYRPGTTLANGEQLSTLLQTGGAPVTSTLYPIVDIPIRDFGSYGNNIGLGVHAANALDTNPGNVPLMSTVKAFLYRFFCGERPSENETAQIISTLGGERSMDLALKDVLNPTTGLSLSFTKRFAQAFEALDDPSTQPLYGPFGTPFIYNTNLETVLQLLADSTTAINGTTNAVGESAYDATAMLYGRTLDVAFGDTPENYPLLNIFTGTDQNGVPYFTIDVANSVKFGGVAFGAGILHYATGGDDGLVEDANKRPDKLANLRIFDALVRAQFKNFGLLDVKFLDSAKYPCSTVWDIGYSLETKKTLLTVMARRRDMWAALSTHAIADFDVPTVSDPLTWRYKPQNDNDTESAIAALLRNVAINYPESELFGTPVCRAIIVGHSGHLLQSTIDNWIPLTLDLADKVAKYMGNSNGRWRSGASFNPEPGNRVTLMRDLNLTYKTPTIYNSDWDNGLIWVQSADRRGYYYPSFQTVYSDDTSVLNSLPTIVCACEVTKVGESVHRSLTSDDTRTDEQFQEYSNQLIAQRAAANRFDNRFVIIPNTFKTDADKQRGFSWTTRIDIGGNVPNTVNSFNITLHRMADLALQQ